MADHQHIHVRLVFCTYGQNFDHAAVQSAQQRFTTIGSVLASQFPQEGAYYKFCRKCGQVARVTQCLAVQRSTQVKT